MRFKQWILNEMVHTSFDTQSINGITADAIDFRFEDWGKGLKSGYSMMPSPKSFLTGSFSAPTKGGWLNINQDGAQAPTDGSSAISLAVTPKVQITPKRLYHPLPANWFQFAVLYLRNQVVKGPEWPRDAYEKVTTVETPYEPVAP